MILEHITYDDLDAVWSTDTDDPYPEGKESLSELDFDRIERELDDEDDRPY